MSFAPSGISAGHIVHVLFDCNTWATTLVFLVCVIQAVLRWRLSLQMQEDPLSGNLSFPKPYVKHSMLFSPDSPKQMDPKSNKVIGQV